MPVVQEIIVLKSRNPRKPRAPRFNARLCASFVALLTVAACSPAWALYVDLFNTTGSWDTAANWDNGVTPWSNASGDTVIDLGPKNGATLIVDSAPTYTGAAFGANVGQPVQLRRVTVGGGNHLTITDGGVLDFSGGGASDSRFLINSGGAGVTMTGGTLTSTRSNLGGIVLGNMQGFDVSGNSIINVYDSTEAGTSGILFSGTPASAGAFHIIGSNPSVTLETIAFSATANPTFKFTLDAAGVSDINVTETLALDTALSTTLNIQDGGLVGTPSQILLFDLVNGSTGAFSQVIAGTNTYAGTEGTLIDIGGVNYTLTYDLNGAGDIGLVVPEPTSMALLLVGAGLILPLRKARK